MKNDTDNKLRLVHNNPHTLTNKTSFTAAYPGHVVTLSETDVPEYNRKGIESDMRDHGKNIQWGDSISIDTKFGKTGRRVAIFSDAITANTDYHDKNDDPILQMLRQSGRWTEVLVPVKDGSEAMYVATLYGISGANQNQNKYRENEILIAASLIRMNSSRTSLTSLLVISMLQSVSLP